MSPTMEEGGIVGWKVKPGEKFASGDVLLEVETDKATIDVEAQDDGIMWEILSNDGALGIPVGKPIALLAEPGDDLSTLERPNLDEPKKEAKGQPKEQKEEPKQPKQEVKEEPKQAKPEAPAPSTDGVFAKANPNQKLTPAVELLLHTKNISAEEALDKIPASGPKGRLLKGDVLAYLGEIDKAAVARVSKYIKSKEHLDLSNITLATKKAAAPAKAEKPKPKNILNITISSDWSSKPSRQEYELAHINALQDAIRYAYSARFPEYATSPSPSFQSDDLFDDLLVPGPEKSRFEVSKAAFQVISGSSAPAQDPFDELLGLSEPQPVEQESPLGVFKFQVKYDDKLVDSKEFVENFKTGLLHYAPIDGLTIHDAADDAA